jgi:hypothetical protein
VFIVAEAQMFILKPEKVDTMSKSGRGSMAVFSVDYGRYGD